MLSTIVLSIDNSLTYAIMSGVTSVAVVVVGSGELGRVGRGEVGVVAVEAMFGEALLLLIASVE